MNKYLAGWQVDDKQWLKQRKADWKQVQVVIKYFTPRDKEQFNVLKEFFITGDVNRANLVGFTAEFLLEDGRDVNDEFDCALYGIHGRIFLLLLFSPVQTEEMYEYVISTIKFRDQFFDRKMIDARKSYNDCAERHHFTSVKRNKESAQIPALAGRDELLYKYLHGKTLEENLEFQTAKNKNNYVFGQLNLFGGMFSVFCSMPYPNELDCYQWNVDYFRSCFSYARDNNITIKDIPLADTALIYYCLFIVENSEKFWPIKVKVAEQFKKLFLEDPLIPSMRKNIDEAFKLWPCPSAQTQCQELRAMCWESWRKATWLDESQFDEVGKPLDCDKQ